MVYAFNDDKSKVEVYSKAEIDTQIVRGESLNGTSFVTRAGMLPYRISGQYNSMQGGCIISQSVIAQVGINNDGDCLVQRINLNTGTVLNENTLNLGHANSVCFDGNNTLYVSGADPSGNRQTVYAVNATTLALVNTYEVPTDENVYALCYSKENGKFYAINNVNSSTISNGTAKLMQLEFNGSAFSIVEEKTITHEVPFYIFALCAVENYIVMASSGDAILDVYTLDMEHLKSIKLDLDADFFTHIMEVEWIDGIDSKNMYIGYTCGESNAFGHGTFAYGKTSIKTNTYNEPNGITDQYNPGQLILYVDSSNTSWNRDGTEANPFQTIYEAVNCVYSSYVRDTLVNVVRTEDIVSNALPIVLFGVSNLTIIFPSSMTDITGVYMRGCEKISITNANLNNPTFSGANGFGIKLARSKDIQLQNCNIVADNAIEIDSYSELIVNTLKPSTDLTTSKLNGKVDLNKHAFAFEQSSMTNIGQFKITNATYAVKELDSQSTETNITFKLPISLVSKTSLMVGIINAGGFNAYTEMNATYLPEFDNFGSDATILTDNNGNVVAVLRLVITNVSSNVATYTLRAIKPSAQANAPYISGVVAYYN